MNTMDPNEKSEQTPHLLSTPAVTVSPACGNSSSKKYEISMEKEVVSDNDAVTDEDDKNLSLSMMIGGSVLLKRMLLLRASLNQNRSLIQ